MSTTSSEGRRSQSSSKQTSSQRTSKRAADGTSTSRSTSRARSDRNLSTAVRAAREQFAELTGRAPEAVTGARSLGDGQGWSVLIDVTELERIPDSTSVLATYRVDLDDDGSIMSYERLRRYTRGATDPV